jgi:hypothetical protein
MASTRQRTHALVWTIAFGLTAPAAYAQGTGPKKDPSKKDAPADAGHKPPAATNGNVPWSPDAGARAADPTPPEPATPPATAAGSGTGSAAAGTATTPGAAGEAGPAGPAVWDSTDVTEKDGTRYYFVGLRYRGNVIPRFLVNLFVDEGATFYSNTVGVELDMRKDGFSLIPAISYVEYGTGDVLFHQHNTDDFAGNWTVVNSSLKAIYMTADLLWSVPIAKSWDFEYGAGFGIGVLFGNLTNNWLYKAAANDPNAKYTASNGDHFAPCTTTGPGSPQGCSAVDHQNSQQIKINGYQEKSWVDGGSVPNVFLHLAVPQFGVRFKPIKQFEARVGLGFSLTGFWFGLSGNYGLERPPQKKEETHAGELPAWGQSGIHF